MKIAILILACVKVLLACPATFAQVVADDSVNTVVTGGGTYLITGGTTTGTAPSLFHSFETFSLSTGDTAVFDLTTSPQVENVFSRVTGGNPSEINGTLTLSGANANLYLLNPAGIVFGPTAQLLLPASFVATTADGLMFENDFVFSASDPQTLPLLTVNTPIGLQMGANAGAVSVNGVGHTLAKLDATGQPFEGAPHVQLGPTTGLQVAPGQTLALVGNGVTLTGGVVTAPSGNLEIGAVAPGEQVAIATTPTGIDLNYDSVNTFQDVSLQQQSLANVSGVAVQINPFLPIHTFTSHQGQLQVAGRQVSLTETSLLLGQNGVAATQPGGPIQVNASEQLLISGSDGSSLVSSGIVGENLGLTLNGDVQLTASDLAVENGGLVTNTTYSTADGGQIDVQVDNQLTIAGFNSQAPRVSSTITSAAFAAGSGGDVNISARDFSLLAGGSATSLNFATGTGGDVTIGADTVLLSGRVSSTQVPSTISSSNFGLGNAGNLTIDTRLLNMQDTSAIGATSSGDGAAGNITINATERIDLSAPITGLPVTTSISSSTIVPNLSEQQLLNLSAVPNGDAGSVIITTPVLEMTGPSSISAQNLGTGDAGVVSIQADRMLLQDNAVIKGRTVAGEIGNITLTVADFLLLRNGSNITTESPGIGNGGNITISTPALLALENSDIVADASQGNGGNITISSQLLLGTQFRRQRTAESDITASSKFGLNGTVSINGIEINPNSGLVELPTEVDDPSQQIAESCSALGVNELVMTGRGGIPTTPNHVLMPNHTWIDFRANSPLVQDVSPSSRLTLPPSPDQLIEATGWHTNATGQIEIVANGTQPDIYAACNDLLNG
ncbi:two-partner secretion domain-containing protein [Leptothoe kymatousa]|uniref:S-layer family protein n=1 Tax=Leptothoe kymatousa TAU-MAC 1615 TaxID=2364775 RepID=A0ABS5Y6K2_9CYAN|nr:S-layer family protein [Leptothoe kymatousa]MBT9313485.1 S-layer family protein [Leptothoe kymatousa TAU-MAC 1615]